MRYILVLMLLSLTLLITGCFQIHNDDSVYYTVPTTNNPHIVPNHRGLITN